MKISDQSIDRKVDRFAESLRNIRALEFPDFSVDSCRIVAGQDCALTADRVARYKRLITPLSETMSVDRIRAK